MQSCWGFRQTIVGLIGLTLFATSSARGQSPPRSLQNAERADTAAVAVDSTREIRTSATDTTARGGPNRIALFRPRDAAATVGVAAVVFSAMQADRSIARVFQRPGVQSRGLRGAANGLSALANPGTIIFSVGAYVTGRVTHSQPIAALGLRTGEAVMVGGAMTAALKGTFGRARPRVDITKPHEFELGKGFGNDEYTSFPSGDVTLAFAAATAASREVSRSWPGAAKYVTPTVYGVASLVAVSRLYKNEHWASDVIGGAGVGTLAGILVDRFNRARPNNIVERILLPASIVPARDQMLVVWRLQP